MTTRKSAGVSNDVLDERLRNMQDAQAERHKTITGRIDDLQRKLDAGLISRKEFDDFKVDTVARKEFALVQRIVFGFVALILLAVGYAFLTLIGLKGSLP